MKTNERGYTLLELLALLGIAVIVIYGISSLFGVKSNTQVLLEEIQNQAKKNCESSNETSGQFAINKAKIPNKLYKELGADLNSVRQHLVKWQKKDDKCQFKICLTGKAGSSAALTERCSKWIDIP